MPPKIWLMRRRIASNAIRSALSRLRLPLALASAPSRDGLPDEAQEVDARGSFSVSFVKSDFEVTIHQPTRNTCESSLLFRVGSWIGCRSYFSCRGWTPPH